VKAGAAGYVLKGASQDELIGAIRRVLAGESALDQELAARLLRRLVGEVNERGNLMREAVERRGELAEPLTPRELEVLELIVRGQTNRQIAESLVLSPSTVKVHVQHIIAKLPVSDRTQAAAFAVEMGLFSQAAEEYEPEKYAGRRTRRYATQRIP
jgi:DNA-binding NarL/FixJ family response regulator